MKIWTDRWPTMEDRTKAVIVQDLKGKKIELTRWLENVCAQLEEIEALEAAEKAEETKK